MVNLVFNLASMLAQLIYGAPASLLGIFLYVAGAVLCSLALFRPQLARYHDILFAEVALVCAVILIFQGRRLDPILQFSQLLLIGAAIFSITECIRLRRIR